MAALSLKSYKRLTVKIGSALLVDRARGLKRAWLASLADDVAALAASGVDVLVVSSGAIALGRTILGLGNRALKLEESQAAAAVGQIALAGAWAEELGRNGLKSGQVLVTLGDTEERRRYLNARATIATLLKMKAVPVINENDTVATSEIRYGDNDRLAARVATMLSADLLVLLSDIDGLYTAPPALDPGARFIPLVDRITPEIEAMAGGAASELSRGGMRTKLDAGKIATVAGTAMIITAGNRLNPLSAIERGERATFFKASANPVKGYKTWIAGQLEPAGRLVVDAGAVGALRSGKSLLPAGVKLVSGSFARGDTVAIIGPGDREVARGLVAYDAADAVRIAGLKTAEIETVLGYEARSAMVHRDDLVVGESAETVPMRAEGQDMLKRHETSGDETIALMAEIGGRARAAARPLAIASTERKNAALAAMADAIIRGEARIIEANAIDMANGEEAGLSPAMLDRLKLDPARIRAMADGIREISGLKDPVGEIIAEWDRPNGLHIERVRTPLGVIGVIYESRPNVTADAGALCLKAGNAVILRGGSDSINSSSAIHACLIEGLRAAGLPEAAIQLVPTTDRAAVGEMLKGLSGNLDVIVPRGGKSLVGRVQAEARVPVFAHLEGICHLYIDGSARLDMAVAIAVDAKMRRTGICGAAETLLVDRAVAGTHLKPILAALAKAGCEIRATEEIRAVFGEAKPASEADWTTEYLDAIISVKLVDGVSEAIDHIETYSSHHTEAIVAEDADAVRRFFDEIDSAILLHNASTQFADGGEFGMGAEIGIATGKMHARGPVGVEQLTSFKYRVRGRGQVRA